jgi:hypothetical protein
MTQQARTFKFELSDGRSIEVTARGSNAAFAKFRLEHGASVKPETVIGMDTLRPKFWIKRGAMFFPISASAAAVCSHHGELK